MAANNIPLFQVAGALSENNLTLPAGVIFDGSQAVIAKTTHTLESVEEIEDLIVGGSAAGVVRLADVATVTFGNGVPDSIDRTNGKPGIGVSITKQPDANTVDVTTAVNDALNGIEGLPPDIELIVVSDQGPEIQAQINTLAREAIFGFFFAVSVVFAFMFTIRPTVVRGFFNTIRPTVVIALSIPLSVLTGILLMFSQDMTLNFMTFGGLAISVGRVVDDSIVVLENVYRHIQGGRERWRAALEATTEVGPAIFASTMTTVVVFLPLAFIPGLFGAFFSPFALTVTFALIASLLVALTAVPVLGAYLLRPGDLPEGAGDEGDLDAAGDRPAAHLHRHPPLGAASKADHAARCFPDHAVEPRASGRHPRQPVRRRDRQPADRGHAPAGDRPGADPCGSRRDRRTAERRLRPLLGDDRRVGVRLLLRRGTSPACRVLRHSQG